MNLFVSQDSNTVRAKIWYQHIIMLTFVIFRRIEMLSVPDILQRDKHLYEYQAYHIPLFAFQCQ